MSSPGYGFGRIHFNPALLGRDALINNFIARRPLLERLLADLRREPPGQAPQHHLLVGQRGMGKSTLLLRLRYAIEDDGALAAQWLPLTFPEEQYNVAALSDFWLNCIDALGDALEERGQDAAAARLDAVRDALPSDDPARAEAALARLLEQADHCKRRLILMIDNLDLVLDRLRDEEWAIRRLLSSEPRLLLIGATSRALEASYEYGRAFYDFFRVHELRGLTEQETRDVLTALADQRQRADVKAIVTKEPGRIRTLHDLSGGNPRTVVLLYQVLESGFDGDARRDLEQLLDLYTPLYKARFEELAHQSQQVIDALALHWDPATAGQVAEAARLSVNATSSQLKRLENQGLVEKVSVYGEKRQGFQLAERFFNIWYLMRASRRVRRRLGWLVRFLQAWYDQPALEREARAHLARESQAADRLHAAEYSLALSEAVADPLLQDGLRRQALRASVDDPSIRTMVDMRDLPPSLQDHQARMAKLAELGRQVRGLKRDWAGIDPAEFWRLLAGSPHLSLPEKQRVVETLSTLSPAELGELHARLVREEQALYRVYPKDREVVHRLYKALGSGELDGPYDWPGARAIAEDTRYRLLPYLAVTSRARHDRPRGRLSPDELERAQDYLRHMREDASLASLGWRGWGVLLRAQLQRLDEAEAAFRKAIEFDPKDVGTWINLGNVLSKLNRLDEAEAACRKAIELDPQGAGPWNHLGIVLSKLNRLDEAEAACRKAIELDPQDAGTWNDLGIVLSKPGRLAEAEAAYRKAIELDPGFAVPWNNLGNALRDLKRVNEAEAAYRKAIELDAQYAVPWVNLGALFQWELNQPDKAEAAYWEAVAIDPALSSPKQGLVHLTEEWLYTDAARSEALAQRLTQEFPEEAQAWLIHAQAVALREDWPVVLSSVGEWLTRWIKEDTQDQSWSWQLGEAIDVLARLVQAGQTAEARKLLETTGAHARLQPLTAALQAVEVGSEDYLSRIAPEVRRAAEEIYRRLQEPPNQDVEE